MSRENLSGSTGSNGRRLHLFQGNQIPGFTIDHDLFDSSDGGRDDRGFAGHGLQIDDSEWFVDRRADEDSGVRVELVNDIFGHHLIDPDYPFSFALRFCHRPLSFPRLFQACRVLQHKERPGIPDPDI